MWRNVYSSSQSDTQENTRIITSGLVLSCLMGHPTQNHKGTFNRPVDYLCLGIKYYTLIVKKLKTSSLIIHSFLVWRHVPLFRFVILCPPRLYHRQYPSSFSIHIKYPTTLLSQKIIHSSQQHISKPPHSGSDELIRFSLIFVNSFHLSKF